MRQHNAVQVTLFSDTGNLTVRPLNWRGRWVSRSGQVSATIEFESAGSGWWWAATSDQTKTHVASCNPDDKPATLQQAVAQAEDGCCQYHLED